MNARWFLQPYSNRRQDAQTLLTLICIGSLASLFGCAKVGQPLPPIRGQLQAVQDLELLQVGPDSVLITFPQPQSSGVDLQLEVYRICGSEMDAVSNRTPQAVVEVAGLEKTTFENGPLDGTRLIYRDRPPRGETCRYSVRLAAGSDRSVTSTTALWTPAPAPPPPDHLQIEVRENEIVLRWDPPQTDPGNIKGYLVDSRTFVSNNEFVDRDVEFGSPKTYRVQTLSSISSPVVASEFSTPLTVVPVDTFPPAVPANVSAVSTPGEVRIFWDANLETDLSGYYVYRGTRPDQPEKISPLISVNRYTDASPPQETVYYQVSAVDQSGNESEKSEAVRVVER